MDIPNELPSRFSAVKPLLIEIGIILSLTVVILLALNFFKVVDIKALFVSQPSAPQVSNIIQAPVQPQYRPANATNSAQNNPYVQNLQLLSRNKALHYAQSINEFEGKINSIDSLGGEDSKSKVKYQVRLELSIGTGSATFVAMYPKEAMDKVKILDSAKKELTIKDLKEGDTVTIKTNIGTLRQYPDNFNEIIITKL